MVRHIIELESLFAITEVLGKSFLWLKTVYLSLENFGLILTMYM